MRLLYHFFSLNQNRTNETRKNPAAYMTNRSAVKKTQKEKSGIDRIKQISPASTRIFGLRKPIKIISNSINSISCGFIVFQKIVILSDPAQPESRRISNHKARYEISPLR